MFGTTSNNGHNKRLKLKNILHLKVDNDNNHHNTSTVTNKVYARKKRPMSATRFTLFKNTNLNVYNISNSNKKTLVTNDLLEIYEIKTMNDMNENKVSIGKYITLGKNDKVLRPLFAKVNMKRNGDTMVKIFWHNTSGDVWDLVFENNTICDNFCNIMIKNEDKDIALLDALLSDDESESDDETLAVSDKDIDLLQLFRDAVSKMNSFKFENEIPQRSTSTPATSYKRLSLIDIQPEPAASEAEYRVASENNNKYKRFSTMNYSTISRDSFDGTRINSASSTSSVKKTILK